MLLRSGFIVAFLTLISRVFGLIRELVIAALFGATAIGDCVNVAFKFPNLFRRIFGEGALSVAFIPLFSSKLEDSKEESQKFGNQVFTLLLMVLVVLCVVMYFLMPYLMFFIAPGFYYNREKFDLAVTLCRITTPYLIFISVTALFGAILNSVKKFALFAITPIIMNVGMIAAMFILDGYMPEYYAVSWSVIVSGVLQVIFIVIGMRHAGFSVGIDFAPGEPEVKKLVRNMGPATLSAGAQQMNLFISQSIASFLPGAVSILSYADRLYQLPLALIGVTFSTILLPELSQIYKRQDFARANDLQNKAIVLGMLLSVPAMCGLVVLSEPIIRLLYERGAFMAEDTTKTAAALSAFAVGLPAFILNKILTPIFYANYDTKNPFKVTLYSMVINSVLNILFMIPFGHVGIAIGSSISGWVNVFLLYKYSRNYGDFHITKSTIIYCIKILSSALIMSISVYYTYASCANYFLLENASYLLQVITLSIAIFIGILAYAASALLQGIHKAARVNI